MRSYGTVIAKCVTMYLNTVFSWSLEKYALHLTNILLVHIKQANITACWMTKRVATSDEKINA